MKRQALLVAITLFSACASRPAPVVPAPVVPDQPRDVSAYLEARARLIAEERALRLSARLVLTADEEAANRSLLALKRAELERTRAYFPGARSFLREETKRLIGESAVFAVMKRLPKGGILHAHGGAMGDFRWLIAHATHRPDCYIYVGAGPTPVRGALRVSPQHPGAGWRRVSELRAEAPDAEAFDEELFRSITLGEEDLNAPDIWEEFTTIFRRMSGLMANRSVAAEYWRRMLAGLIQENVQYLESRGTPIDPAIIREVRSQDPQFDMKFIHVAGRAMSRERVALALNTVVEQRATNPDLVKGFDLVEEEDWTNPNLFFVDELLSARRAAERRGVDLPLYLHSGESNWAENENLYDAVLLGASRIGHGIALVKHPRLMEIVRSRGIAIEVCPTSNQILGYVPDLRNHPAGHYINAGLSIVLSPDDAGIMRNSLSHDFYVAFMAWGLDLRDLKQIAMNSLLHSAMTDDEKRRALAEWTRRWGAFVTWINGRAAAQDKANPW
jgi:adenosine deaminase CECR1